MNFRNHLHTLLHLVNELIQNKEKEILKLIKSKNAYPWLIELKKEEAQKLKKLAEGLTLVGDSGLIRLEVYMSLDKKLRHLTQTDPCLKGHIITLGPDQPELKPYFSRVTCNIPITFYKP
jgi:hypothetical protein